MSDDLGTWAPLTVPEVAALLATLNVPWWIAGGWAVDLALGRQTRPHHDIDVEVFRDDQVAVRRQLRDWDLHLAHDGRLTPWPEGDPVPLDTTDIWCRTSPGAPWSLQLMLNPGTGTNWVSKRDLGVTSPLSRAVRRTAGDVPYLAAELQLLMKAKSVRPHDELDFVNAAPTLDDDARAWLVAALERCHPGHRWAARL